MMVRLSEDEVLKTNTVGQSIIRKCITLRNIGNLFRLILKEMQPLEITNHAM